MSHDVLTENKRFYSTFFKIKYTSIVFQSNNYESLNRNICFTRQKYVNIHFKRLNNVICRPNWNKQSEKVITETKCNSVQNWLYSNSCRSVRLVFFQHGKIKCAKCKYKSELNHDYRYYDNQQHPFIHSEIKRKLIDHQQR